MRRSTLGFAGFFVVASFASGCGDGTTPDDGSTGVDGASGGTDAGGGFDGGPDFDAGPGHDAGGGTDAGGGMDAGPPSDAGTGGPCSGASDCAHLNEGAHCNGDSLDETVGLCVTGACMAVNRRIEDCTAMTMPRGCDGDAIAEDSGYCDSGTASCRTRPTTIPCAAGICSPPPVQWSRPEVCRIRGDGVTGGCVRPGAVEDCVTPRVECSAVYFYVEREPGCTPEAGCSTIETTTDCRTRNGTSCDPADPTQMAIGQDCVCNALAADGCTCREMRTVSCGAALTACIDGTRLLDCSASTPAFCIDSSAGGGLCSNCVVTTCSSACVAGVGGAGSCT